MSEDEKPMYRGGDEMPKEASTLLPEWTFRECHFSLPVGTLLINEAATFEKCTIHYYPKEKTEEQKQKFTDAFFPTEFKNVIFFPQKHARIKFVFAWYDLWIGFFYDRKKKWLYFFPIPMCGVIIKFRA